MQRTFGGNIAGLEVGSKIEVITMAGMRPHRDTATIAQYVVVRRDGDTITAEPTVFRIDEEREMFTTYSTAPGAPLRRHD